MRVPRRAALLLACTGLVTAAVALEPRCEHPAELRGRERTTRECFVLVRAGRDWHAVALELGKKYHFGARVFRVLHGFAIARVSPYLVARLRCEPDVESISYEIPTAVTAQRGAGAGAAGA